MGVSVLNKNFCILKKEKEIVFLGASWVSCEGFHRKKGSFMTTAINAFQQSVARVVPYVPAAVTRWVPAQTAAQGVVIVTALAAIALLGVVLRAVYRAVWGSSKPAATTDSSSQTATLLPKPPEKTTSDSTSQTTPLPKPPVKTTLESTSQTTPLPLKPTLQHASTSMTPASKPTASTATSPTPPVPIVVTTRPVTSSIPPQTTTSTSTAPAATVPAVPTSSSATPAATPSTHSQTTTLAATNLNPANNRRRGKSPVSVSASTYIFSATGTTVKADITISHGNGKSDEGGFKLEKGEVIVSPDQKGFQLETNNQHARNQKDKLGDFSDVSKIYEKLIVDLVQNQKFSKITFLVRAEGWARCMAPQDLGKQIVLSISTALFAHGGYSGQELKLSVLFATREISAAYLKKYPQG